MIATRPILFTVFVCLGAILRIAPAHADYFSSWIALTCDAGSGLATVRFGYADGDAAPLFQVLPDSSIDHGTSKVPVSNATQGIASCKLPGGRKVKARLGPGKDEFSIWINGKRVAHDFIGATVLPFELNVESMGYRLCTFQLPQGDWVYDVTSAAYKATPIKCDTGLTPLPVARAITSK